jgi:hypothetical protein
LAVKLTCENVTKRVRDTPETFEALKQTVKASMCKGNASEYVMKGQYSITYVDDTGDTINVSDDEDLQTAYEVAENSMNRHLKLQIKRRENPQVEEDQIDSKLPPKIESQPIQIGKLFVEEAEEQFEPIDAVVVKQTIQDLMKNVKEDKEESCPDSDFVESPAEDKKKKKEKIRGGMPRKNFKRFVKKELEKQCKGVFKDMINSKIEEKNSEAD